MLGKFFNQSKIALPKVALCTALIVGLTACGGSSGGGGISTVFLPDGTSLPAPEFNPVVPTQADLQGSFTSGCVFDPLSGSSEGSFTETITVEGNTLVGTLLSFTDNDCTVPALPAEFVTEESFVLPGGSVTTSLGEAAFIDVTLESLTEDGELTSEFLALTEPDVTFTIFLITTDGLWFSGETFGINDGSSPALRPATLDTDFAFTRL